MVDVYGPDSTEPDTVGITDLIAINADIDAVIAGFFAEQAGAILRLASDRGEAIEANGGEH